MNHSSYNAVPPPSYPTPASMPEGDDLCSALSSHIADLGNMAGRFQSFADRLNGGTPAVVGSGTSGMAQSAAQPPITSRLRTADERLVQINQWLSETIQRLEAFA